jgi:hypothetical protein
MGTSLLWFTNYLAGRTQKVEVNGEISDSRELLMSVFQSTILGPLLYDCFINDLPNATELFTVLYADDTTGLDSDSDLPSLLQRTETELVPSK